MLVISPGQGEPALKYAELVYDLKDTGYDIFVIDHRGQGASDRHGTLSRSFSVGFS